MYVIEFQSSLDGNEFLAVNEFDLVEKVIKIVDTFRRAGYAVSGSFHKTARRFCGEYVFQSNTENVHMAIV